MVNKGDIELELRKLQRRIMCRSESRVKENLLFDVLFAVLTKVNSWNEDELIAELEKGKIKFRQYQRISGNEDQLKTIDLTIEIFEGNQ